MEDLSVTSFVTSIWLLCGNFFFVTLLNTSTHLNFSCCSLFLLHNCLVLAALSLSTSLTATCLDCILPHVITLDKSTCQMNACKYNILNLTAAVIPHTCTVLHTEMHSFVTISRSISEYQHLSQPVNSVTAHSLLHTTVCFFSLVFVKLVEIISRSTVAVHSFNSDMLGWYSSLFGHFG